jgi:hypothetical protein
MWHRAHVPALNLQNIEGVSEWLGAFDQERLEV